MKFFFAVIIGALVSFTLTICSAVILYELVERSIGVRFAMWGLASPIIALVVGSLVGLLIAPARRRSQMAAAVALTPWAVWELTAMRGKGGPVVPELIAVASSVVYLALGIGAAMVVTRLARRQTLSATTDGQT